MCAGKYLNPLAFHDTENNLTDNRTSLVPIQIHFTTEKQIFTSARMVYNLDNSYQASIFFFQNVIFKKFRIVIA